jgi:hypothetical protein
MTEYYEPPIANTSAQAEENKLVNKALTKLPQPYLSGLKLNADVSINGLRLNTIDQNDVIWVVTDIDGWWTLPESEIPDLPRGWGDGSYDAVGRFANRIITLNGSFLTQDPADAPEARDALITAANLVKTGGWLVVYEDKATNPSANGKAAYVRLSGAPQIASVSARGRHDFSIGLKAVDPIKYEYVDGNYDGYNYTTITASGGGTGQANVINTGNVAVPVIIELSKAFTIPGNTLPTITNTENDQAITIVAGTGASTRLEIDTYNREVLAVEYNYANISNVVANGTNAVYTTATASGAAEGTLVSVTGITPSSLNIVDAEVIAISGNTFTVASTATAAYVSGGQSAVLINTTNAREKASVLIDWIYLEPGTNTITIANFPSGATCTIYYRSGWIG